MVHYGSQSTQKEGNLIQNVCFWCIEAALSCSFNNISFSKAIKLARNNFDMMCAVGVGGKAHVDKLVDFSTSEDHVRQVNNFQDLQNTVLALSDDICRNIEGLVESKKIFYFKFTLFKAKKEEVMKMLF